MVSVVASLLAGFGMFFVGMHQLTENLKTLSSRQLRESVATWTRRPLLGLIWGGLAVLVSQSGAVVTFLLVSMLRSGMITVPQSLPIIIGCNVFGSLSVLILVIDIKAGMLLLIGVAGIFSVSTRASRLRTVAFAAFGIGLLFLGLRTMQEGVAPLAETPWFQEFLQQSGQYYFTAFVAGAILSCVAQTSIGVTVLTAAFYAAGVLSLGQSMMIAYGSNVGSSVLLALLSSKIKGESRQIAMFQTFYNCSAAVIMVPLFYIEVFLGIPLVRSLLEHLLWKGGEQIAIAYFLFNLAPGLILIFLPGPLAAVLRHFWPRSSEEEESQPKYIHDQAVDDPTSAIDLIRLEQVRIIGFLSAVLELLRNGGSPARIAARREALATLSDTIRETIGELQTHHRLADEAYEQLNGLLSVQQSVESADALMADLAEKFDLLKRMPAGGRFAAVVIEGLDAIVLTLQDVAGKPSPEEFEMLLAMTSDQGNIASVRSAYLAGEIAEDGVWRRELLSAANLTERLIWLFGSIARTYQRVLVDPRSIHSGR